MIIPILAILLPVLLLGGLILFVLAIAHVLRPTPARAEASLGSEIAAIADRMERRIATLERILDVDSPGLRHRL